MQVPNIDPIILSIGPLAISWYSCSYVAGIVFGWWYSLRLAKNFNLAIKPSDIEDFITWLIIAIILGGRLGYVVIYDPVKYFSNPVEILKTYEGGMSFHGAVIGIIITSIIFSKVRKIELGLITDLLVSSAGIGIFLGRIANFINGELYGRITDVAWAVEFPYGGMVPRHPSQLYEALLEGAVSFVVINILIYRCKLLKHRWSASAVFLIIYGTARMFVELFREPDLQIGFIAHYFTMGQILCLPMILVGILLLARRIQLQK